MGDGGVQDPRSKKDKDNIVYSSYREVPEYKHNCEARRKHAIWEQKCIAAGLTKLPRRVHSFRP